MFSRKPGPDARPQTGANGVGATFSVLAADLVVTGDLRASADLHIDGSVDGSITCAALVQGESSTIRGAITADSARLSGTVHGPVDAGQLVILKTARIHGDVTYDTLTVEQGALVEGRFARRGAGSAEATLTLVS